MRRVLRAAVGVAVSLGFGVACAPNVKVLQREGCWVKQTESFPKTVTEEVGFCARKPPAWSNDRVTRLVQECMAEADYRWQQEALAAWSRGKDLPRQSTEEDLMKTCMDRAGTVLVHENETLKRRVAELTAEQEKLEQMAREDREHFRAAQEQMTEALGEAAKKPAPSAFATANSQGTATNESEQTADRTVPNNTTITLPTNNVPTVVPIELPKEKPKAAPKSETACVPKPSTKKGGGVTCALPAEKAPLKLDEKAEP